MKQIQTAEDIASAAILSMMLEVSAYPKPGNVHRRNDFSDTSFEHFLASASAVQPVYLKGAAIKPNQPTSGFGPLFYEAVFRSKEAQSGGNTHFGTFILLIPLVIAAGQIAAEKDESSIRKRKEGKDKKLNFEIIQKAAEICRRTAPEDAICFYKAFQLLTIPVQEPEKDSEDFDLDLTNPAAVDVIRQREIPLFDIMALGAARDMVAAEWTNGFEKTEQFAQKLLKNKEWFDKNPKKRFGSSINSAVVYTFVEMLAKYPDTFIEAKQGQKKALKVQKEAAKILKISGKKNKKNSKNLKKIMPELQKFDKKLDKKKLNPGSTADIAAVGIFIALLSGLKI
ncbi:triphosphoribosyl-dephospho-CoA synthase [Methanimicrococcus sp. OttesenSCG-928-J09]|nr:triphosphoribosyl-dephospho-CoA synthase [Methanimicrococcus sp. OttesenSCG-928-J09]